MFKSHSRWIYRADLEGLDEIPTTVEARGVSGYFLAGDLVFLNVQAPLLDNVHNALKAKGCKSYVSKFYGRGRLKTDDRLPNLFSDLPLTIEIEPALT